MAPTSYDVRASRLRLKASPVRVVFPTNARMLRTSHVYLASDRLRTIYDLQQQHVYVLVALVYPSHWLYVSYLHLCCCEKIHL